ncbi:MAG: acetyl-CoA carboxylase biotin carboxyl carrier protein, partial [Hyphomicrobiales bacterium]
MSRAKSAAVDKDLIRELARLLEETGLGEIEIQQEGFKVRVARPATAHAAAPAPAPEAGAAPPSPEPR